MREQYASWPLIGKIALWVLVLTVLWVAFAMVIAGFASEDAKAAVAIMLL